MRSCVCCWISSEAVLWQRAVVAQVMKPPPYTQYYTRLRDMVDCFMIKAPWLIIERSDVKVPLKSQLEISICSGFVFNCCFLLVGDAIEHLPVAISLSLFLDCAVCCYFWKWMLLFVCYWKGSAQLRGCSPISNIPLVHYGIKICADTIALHQCTGIYPLWLHFQM